MPFDYQRTKVGRDLSIIEAAKQIYSSENMQSTADRKRVFSPPIENREWSPPLGIEVVGRHVLLFDDDSTAEFINSSNALLPWNGDSNLVLDRYDVRHLLQDLSGLRKKRVPQPDTDVTDEELDFERYRDLDNPDDPASDDGETSKRQKSTAGGYKDVPFSYGTEETSTGARKSEDGMESSDFKPPFWVPDNLLDKLPPSEKIHQIITRTAKFVSDHGGQSEIVLRVKQGNNPAFGFLMPDHHLHLYFRFLVDHPELLGANKEADVKHTAKTTAPGEGLSLLGSVYGTGEDEDEAGAPDTEEDESSIQDRSGDDTFSMENGKAFEQAESSTLKCIEEDICSTQLHKALNEEHCHTDNQSPTLGGSGHTSDETPSANAVRLHDVTGNKLLSFPVKSLKSKPHKANAFGLEPPLFLKRIIQKMVEFIVRNGKEFEAIVRDQDRKIGRFPFLLTANKYHPYYLKVLEEAQQAKSHEKKPTYDNFGLATDVHLNEARETSQPQELNKLSGGAFGFREEDVTVIPPKKIDVEKKPKFKIVIGGIKNDGNDIGSGKHPGMTSEAAASAVRAATKRPTSLHVFSQGIREVKKSEKEECGMSTDAAAAIVMAATRGVRRPKQGATSGSGAVQGSMLEKIRRSISEDSEGIGSAGMSMSQSDISHCRSSNGDLTFPQPVHGVSASNSKSIADGDLTRPMPAKASGAPGSILKLDDPGIRKDDVSVAKVMVKAAALAAAGEADSSEACLSREDKRKAERLKRAKMFAALIKSGQHILEDTDARSNPPGGVASVLHEAGSKLAACAGTPTVGSLESGPVKSRVSVESAKIEECEDLSKAETVSKENNTSNTKSAENEIHNHNHIHDHRHRHHDDRHKRTKSHRHKHDDNNDDNERRERRHNRESHRDHKRSERETRNKHNEDEHRRRRHRSISSEDERRRHRHPSISKDRDSRKRHDRYESPEDGYSHRGKDGSNRKHQKRSRSMREQDSRVGDLNLESNVPVSSVQVTEVLAPQVSQPSINTTDVPEDLRAKVRAMLLATM